MLNARKRILAATSLYFTLCMLLKHVQERPCPPGTLQVSDEETTDITASNPQELESLQDNPSLREASIPHVVKHLFHNESNVTSRDVHVALRKVDLPPMPYTLPYATSCVRRIRSSQWVTQLYQFLQSLNKSISPQVNMVFGDSDHMELLLNWIIAAHVRLDPPLHNIMVLSVDQPLCDFLASKKLPVACIAVPPESFLVPTSLRPKSWEQSIKSRLVVLRIINFWGYDVASYDSDAVLLRNPQSLYDNNPDVKFFAGTGTFPQYISNQWGFTVCGCVLVLRSHRSVGS